MSSSLISHIENVPASNLPIGKLARITTGQYKDYIIVKTYDRFITVYSPDSSKNFYSTWSIDIGNSMSVEILPNSLSVVLRND